MQHSQAISENVSLKDLQTSYSTEYRLWTALIFTTADCEYMYTAHMWVGEHVPECL